MKPGAQTRVAVRDFLLLTQSFVLDCFFYSSENSVNSRLYLREVVFRNTSKRVPFMDRSNNIPQRKRNFILHLIDLSLSAASVLVLGVLRMNPSVQQRMRVPEMPRSQAAADAWIQGSPGTEIPACQKPQLSTIIVKTTINKKKEYDELWPRLRTLR